MAGLYANKFTVECNDMARIIFNDERAPVGEGLPKSISTAADVVMTHANFIELTEVMLKVVAQLKAKQ